MVMSRRERLERFDPDGMGRSGLSMRNAQSESMKPRDPIYGEYVVGPAQE